MSSNHLKQQLAFGISLLLLMVVFCIATYCDEHDGKNHKMHHADRSLVCSDKAAWSDSEEDTDDEDDAPDDGESDDDDLSASSYEEEDEDDEEDEEVCPQEPKVVAPAEWKADAFAFDVFRKLVADGRIENPVFSPASLENLLRLLGKGAAGKTLEGLRSLPMGQEGIVSAMAVHSADALFVAEDMPFKSVDGVPVHRAPLGVDAKKAAELINAWCGKQTHGTIPQMVGPEQTRNVDWVALNAVYLREEWLHPFDSAWTVPYKFHLPNGNWEKVQMMRHFDLQFYFAETEEWQAVALFYAPQRQDGVPACFIGILPKMPVRDFAARLTAEKFNEIRSKLLQTHAMVEVYLPRMEIAPAPVDLSAVLAAYPQLAPMFTPGAADFSGFSDSPLHIQQIWQRCHVVVDEKATTASAVSESDDEFCEEDTDKRQIVFDSPFIWLISDLTTASAPYFIGICDHP